MAHRGRQNADEVLSLALASGKTARDAAAELKLGERTVTRRLADPAFRARVHQLRGEMVAGGLGRLADGMTEAANVRRGLLKSDSEAIRLNAARSLLQMANDLRRTVELEAELQTLNQRLEEVASAQEGSKR